MTTGIDVCHHSINKQHPELYSVVRDELIWWKAQAFHVWTVTLNFTSYASQLRDLEQICLSFLICKTETVAPASNGCF